MSETDDKIKIEWNDLHTRRVDQRLKEQEAVERNRRQAELNPLTTTAAAPGSKSLWYNSVFMMACFGLLGGLLAWGGGEAMHLRSSPEMEAREQIHSVVDLMNRQKLGQITLSQAKNAIDELKSNYADNPFFAVNADMSLSPEVRDAKLAALRKQEAMKTFVANLMSFGFAGLLIGVCLSIAEPVVDHNWTVALVNGSVAAAAGLMGGAAASFIFDKLLHAFSNGAPLSDEVTSTQILAHAVAWGAVGLFLTIGPGLVMRNLKKLTIGLLGGLVGGLIGGALYDPIYSVTDHNEHLGRLATLVGIGLFAGLGTGLIENAAKSGWVKVTAGLIAGKQFILYRNPTFIGSGPECPIYLFRDAQVGKRHAAIHIVPGGFELENLPLGGDTKINGKPVARTRLRAGDEIQVGMTTFLFQEKVRA
jgi:hypothetical protein